MPRHEKLFGIPFSNGAYQFCLDRIDQSDTGEDTRYAFVWRGTSRGPEGFQQRPAYFDWMLLGQALRIAITAGHLTPQQVNEFFLGLCGRDAPQPTDLPQHT